MVVNIRVKVNDRRLRNLVARNQYIKKEVLKKVVDVGRKNTVMGITKGRPEWPPLSERRINEKGHGRILFETGALLRSIISQASTMQGMYGTNISYAPVHELGLLEGEGVPRRAFLLPTTEGRELQEIEKAVEKLARMLYIRETQ